MRARAAIVVVGAALGACAATPPDRRPDDAATQTSATHAPAAAAHPANAPAGLFERLNAMQREAGALKSTLAVRDFWRQRHEQNDGAMLAVVDQVLAAAEAELGAYDEAVLHFPYGAPAMRERAAPFPTSSAWRAVDAVDGIATLSTSRRIVLVNEAHHVAQTRALTLALLPRLRALGFTHFAAEGLDERDRELSARGYPLDTSGVYIREPLYGEIIRSALRLGFVVVPYESATSGADTDAREQEQAEQLARRVFGAAPQARLFVHAGYAHVHKRAGYLDAEPMAMRLARLTGFEPLSVDQTVLRPADPPRESPMYRSLLREFGMTAPSVLIARADGSPWTLQPGFYDISVILPAPSGSIVGRPDWLTLAGEREAVPIDVDFGTDHLPCVVEARYAGEGSRAVPADRAVAERGGRRQVVLFLRPGRYRLSAADAAGRVIFERELRVEAAHPR